MSMETRFFSAFEQRVCVEVGGEAVVLVPDDLRLILKGTPEE